jgi:vitamin B12 transporter
MISPRAQRQPGRLAPCRNVVFGSVATLLLLGLAGPAAAQQPVPLDTLRATTGSRLVAGAAAATRSIQVLQREQLQAMPVRSVQEALARALGVDLLARSPAQADIALRGSGFEQVLVMVDGVPVNDDQTGHFHLSLAVPLEAVERIEILRGPASALYGSSAVGGVINVVTRPLPASGPGADGAAPAAATITARIQAGSFGAVATGADVAAAVGTATTRLSADLDRSDGHRPGTDYTILQLRGTVDAPLAGGTVTGLAGYAARDFGAEGFYAPFDSYEETRTATASIAWRSAPAAFALEPRLAFRQHDDDFILVRDNPALYRNIHTTRLASAELVARWAPADALLRVAAGAEGTLSSLRSTNLGDRQEERGALFAELAAGDAAALLATLGARVDHHSTFGAYLSPSLAAGYQATPHLRIRGSAASGFRAPTWTDRFYRDLANIGDPELRAETFRTAELGLALAGPAGLALDLALFVRDASNLIDWARPTDAAPTEPWRTRNVESARFRGMETSLTGQVGPAALSLQASLLGVDASTPDGWLSKYALRPLTRTAALEAALPVALGVSATARATAFRRAPDDRWHRVDLRVSRGVGRLQLFADLTNLTDTEYRDVSDRPAPGRAWSVGGRTR